MTSSTPRRPSSEPIAEFAASLRHLRVEAGSPTLASLQNTTGISRTVISEAFAGRQLPSARTVAGIVRACNGDPTEWLRRRDAIAAGLSPDERTVDDETPPRRQRRLLLVATIAFCAGALIAAGITSAALGARIGALDGRVATLTQALAKAGPVNPHAQIVVRTGVDPAMTPCVNDAKVSASEDRVDNTRIQIIWSNKCYAGWARIARYDGKADGNEVKISIYPETAPNGPDRQDATEPGVQGAYTTLIVRPSPQTRLCATGSITVAGKEIDLGDPICS